MFKRVKTKSIEKNLMKWRAEIPVNQHLKQSLRTRFGGKERGKRKKIGWTYGVAAAAALVLLFASVLFNIPNSNRGENTPHGRKVLAAELNITSAFSFVDILGGGNLAPAVWQDYLYIPVSEKGVYRLSTRLADGKKPEMVKVLEAATSFISVSHDGKRLAFANDKGIFVKDLENGAIKTVVEGNGIDLFYEEPTWSHDDSRLVITKKVIEWKEHGFEVKSQEIYTVTPDGKEAVKITDGSYGTMAPDGLFIVFERDRKIMKRDLSSGQEMTIDDGRFPALSPEGGFVAYVKSVQTKREVKPNVFISDDLSDVYIASVADPADRKKVTANYSNQHISPEEWLAKVNTSPTPQTLVLPGAYSYYNPVWGRDFGTLYVLKSPNREGGEMRLMRIAMAQKVLPVAEVVSQWLEAVVNRDDDYAKSLMTSPPAVLTISNPHPVGYTVLASGSEHNQPYVDAEQYLAYTANPYHQILRQRFYLKETGRGYLIDEIKEIGNIQVYERDGIVWEESNGKRRELIGLQDLQPATGQGAANRISALAYSRQTGKVLFAVQNTEGFAVKLFDVSTRIVVDVTSLQGHDLVAMDASFSAGGRYAVLNYGGLQIPYSVLLYDVQSGRVLMNESLPNAPQAHWAGENLVLYSPYDGGYVRWELDPPKLLN